MEINEKVTLLQFLKFCCESNDEDDDLEFLMNMSSSNDESEEKEVKDFITVVDLGLNRQSETQIKPHVKEYVERIVSNYTAEKFKTHFSGRKPVPVQKQLLLALWMMATPDSYRPVFVKFDVGKATAIRIMRRVTYALHTLAPRFIQWPQGERATKVMEEFERASGFPKVIGAIDGTHIKIITPQEDKQSYVNRKEYHSIHVQSSARISIERAIGLEKIRGRSILDCLAMITIEKIPEYLVATCVLHNICILKGDLIDFNQAYKEDTSFGTLISARVEDGNAKRQRIMNNLIMRVN